MPGDGAHVVYPLLMGLTRARYFLLTSEAISAEQLAEKPPLVLRHARTFLAQELRRRMLDMQGYGLALEGLANVDDQPKPILQRDFPDVTQVKLRTEL